MNLNFQILKMINIDLRSDMENLIVTGIQGDYEFSFGSVDSGFEVTAKSGVGNLDIKSY